MFSGGLGGEASDTHERESTTMWGGKQTKKVILSRYLCLPLRLPVLPPSAMTRAAIAAAAAAWGQDL